MTQPGTQKLVGQAHNPIFKPHRSAAFAVGRGRDRDGENDVGQARGDQQVDLQVGADPRASDWVE